MTMEFEIFTTITEAAASAKIMRKNGWIGARAVKSEAGYYYIVTHKAMCRCGRCPVLRDDGFVR